MTSSHTNCIYKQSFAAKSVYTEKYPHMIWIIMDAQAAYIFCSFCWLLESCVWQYFTGSLVINFNYAKIDRLLANRTGEKKFRPIFVVVAWHQMDVCGGFGCAECKNDCISMLLVFFFILAERCKSVLHIANKVIYL